jgi:hypothetical protein
LTNNTCIYLNTNVVIANTQERTSEAPIALAMYLVEKAETVIAEVDFNEILE